MTPQAFMDQMVKEEKVQLLDVRTPGEYSGGFIKGAVNMDFNSDAFEEEIGKLSKDIPVMVYCKAGGRSAQAADLLESKGFKKIYDLKGGILAWEHAGLGIVKGVPSEDQNAYSLKQFHETIGSKEPVIIDFYAEWCGPCKRMSPVFNRLALEHKNVQMVGIDVDKAKDVASYLGIEALPLIVVFKDGVELRRIEGEQSEADLRALVKEYEPAL